MIKKPTRITQYSATLIYNIFTNIFTNNTSIITGNSLIVTDISDQVSKLRRKFMTTIRKGDRNSACKIRPLKLYHSYAMLTYLF